MNELTLGIETYNDNVRGLLANLSFNPLIILEELTAEINDISNEKKYNNKTRNKFKQTIETYFNEGDFFEYCEKMCILRNMIVKNQYLSIAELERLKPFLNLQFSFEIVHKIPVTIKKHQKGFVSEPLRLGFCDIEKAFDKTFESEHYFIYRCHVMEDVPFAILHYLVLNQYKFKMCEHCGKYFATKTLKQKYCMRKSPYKGYEHLECSQAVDHLNKKLAKRKKSIMTILDNYYPKAKEAFWSEFNNLTFVDGKPIEKSCEVFEKLEEITDKKHIRDTWYKDEYK